MENSVNSKTEENGSIESPSFSKAETELRLAVSKVAEAATSADIAAAESIATAPDVGVHTITPAIAAVLVMNHNVRNRSLTVSKVYGYVGAIARGEWKLNHQGIAFYADASLADGQHRCNAIALGDTAIKTVVFPNFDKTAIDTIDRSKQRTAGEALEMMGIKDGKVLATIGKTAMEYEFELDHGKRPQFTDPQVEAWVMDHHDSIAEGVRIGANSSVNVSEICLGAAEAKTIATLMLLGGWADQMVVAFLSAVQQGVATYPQSPVVSLHGQYLKAKLSAKKTDGLTKKEKLALAMKGAAIWANNGSVSKLVWKAAKEPLPSNQAVETEAVEAA